MQSSTCRLVPLLAAALLAAGCATHHEPPHAPDPARQQVPTTTTTTTSPASPPAAPDPVAASADVLFLGDVFWGRYVEDAARASDLGTAHPFSGLHGLDRERYDAWIGNLECPVVPGLDVPSAEQERLLSFNCEPDFLPDAAQWFTAFSLANNHTDNQGEAGLTATRRLLDRAGIQHFGDADPRRLDRVCNIVAVPVDVANDDGSTDRGRLPLAMCGFNGVFRIPPDRAVEQLARYADLLPTIAMPHNGLEYTSTPDSIKVAFDRGLVDAGADMVLGGHPHWIQSAEVYRGRLIAYSLGNFIFDQTYDGEVTRSAAIEVTMSTAGTDSADLARWLALGETCRQQRGDCWDQVRAADLPELSLDYELDVVGTTSTGGVTGPADAAQTRAIEDRLDWAAVDAALGGR